MTDMETAALEEEFMPYNSQEEGARPSYRTTRGSTRVIQEAEGMRGKCRPESLLLNKEVVGSCLVGMSPTEQEANTDVGVCVGRLVI